MITNEKQYRITRGEAERFKAAIGDYDIDAAVRDGTHPQIALAQREQLLSEHENLVDQIREYEALRSGEISSFESPSLADLPLILVKARIARNWTQKELAEALGYKEQQLQRYEADLYRSASLKTLVRVANALDLEIEETGRLLDEHADRDLSRTFPFNEMYKHGWFERFSGTLSQAKKNANELISNFLVDAGLSDWTLAMHRRVVRTGSTFNENALTAWQARVLIRASDQHLPHRFDASHLTNEWFRELAKLSQFDDGPNRAEMWLIQTGIHFVVERHLQQTHLDGASMLTSAGIPVVALTLRHDRLDNFWFVLFHELAHIVLHILTSPERNFFDDSDSKSDGVESEADDFALEMLIPSQLWENSIARFTLSTETIVQEARNQQIHPSILAGRIRNERKDYILLTDLVGQGKVRGCFEHARDSGG